MRRQPALHLLLAAAAALLAACPKPEDPCSNDRQKAATLDLVADWYLYPELLPPSFDAGQYATPSDVLDALTANARAQGKDRFWSYVTTVAAQQQFFAEGTFVGFGIGTLVRGSRLYVSQVYAGSAAAGAGFLRGDEIVAIGEADPLTPVSTLIANGTVGSAFGPATTGLTRLFDVVPRGGGQTQRRPMSKALYSLDPVPAAGIQVLDPTGTGTPKVGYLALRTFISPADARLDAAFATFKTAGVTDVIVDLRYNGGGLVSTAEHLANLLAGGLAGTMYELSNNPRHAASNFNQVFTPATSSLAPAHVAFLVSGATASAGELVPNVLAPARTTSLALVGRQTYGKPVGQRGFTSSQCGVVVFLVSFKIANGAGFGDYFGGLPAPGFAGCSVPATDDLVHETWDPAETQTAAALQWLTSGSCPALPPGPLAAGAVAPADAYPEAVQPTEAQRHVRGLF